MMIQLSFDGTSFGAVMFVNHPGYDILRKSRAVGLAKDS